MNGAVSPDNISRFLPSNVICTGSKFWMNNNHKSSSTKTRKTCNWMSACGGMCVSNILVVGENKSAQISVTKGIRRIIEKGGGTESKFRKNPLLARMQLLSTIQAHQARYKIPCFFYFPQIPIC